jgi:hypothetical protein
MKNSNVILIACAVIGGLVLMGKTVGGSVLEIMAGAIRDWESGGDLQARSYRNNNPGNLRWFNEVDTIPWEGATALDAQNHVIFASYADGWNALIHQLSLAFSGGSSVYSPRDTLYQFFAKYAEENSVNYARFVAARLGVSAETQLQNITTAA